MTYDKSTHETLERLADSLHEIELNLSMLAQEFGWHIPPDRTHVFIDGDPAAVVSMRVVTEGLADNSFLIQVMTCEGRCINVSESSPLGIFSA